MKYFKSAVAAIVAIGSFGAALAADQTINLLSIPSYTSTGVGAWDSTPSPGFDGLDVITFQGIAAGLYDISIGVYSTDLTNFSVSLDGMAPTQVANGTVFRFAGYDLIGPNPIALTISGDISPTSTYQGAITVTAVPEPSTYAMMFAGLAVIGATVRRRKGSTV